MNDKIIDPKKMFLTPNGRRMIQRFWIEEPNELVACLKDFDEEMMHFTKENGDINPSIIAVMDKLNELDRQLTNEREYTKRLEEENHRLRLSLLHQDNVIEDIKWFKKHISSDNQVFTLIDAKIKEVKPFDKGLCRRALTELKMEIRGDRL